MAEWIVFSGPSLTPADRARYPSIRFLPPVASGDLFAQVRAATERVAIIDGYFGDRRAIGHKEILWAMARGVAVLGGASLGALRAAELDVYGMLGVGEIYRGYRSGVLVDDADVAVVHGPEHVGYAPLSIALVDVRATLDALETRGLLGRAERDRLWAAARGLHFSERTWESLDAAAGRYGSQGSGGPRGLAAAHVERKRLDALAVLRRISGSAPARPRSSRFYPPQTITFRADLRRAGLDPDSGAPLSDL